MDKQWLAEQVRAGKSDKEIGGLVGLTAYAIGYHRRRLGVAPRPHSERVKAAIKAKWPEGRKGEAAANWRGGKSPTGSGYMRVYKPDHPGANPNGYVYEHRLVMEQKIGRLLKPGEIVDHIDRDRGNNAPENLRLHANRSEHVHDHFAARDQLTVANRRVAELEAELAALKANRT